MTDSPSTDYPDPPVEVETLAPAALGRQIDAGKPVRLLDVRDRDEIEAWRIEGPGVTRTNIPYAKFMSAQVNDGVADLAADVAGEGPITVVCGYGEASAYVAGLLAEEDIAARNLADGMRGWARVYEAREIEGEDATVVQYRRPASGCLGYMVVSGDEAVVVDPLRAFTDRYLADARERDATVIAAVDTHVHADHVSGLRDLAAAADARRVMPAPAVDRGVTFDVETVTDGETLAVGETSLRAVHLPGHTTGMTGFAVDGVLLTGDSLFLDGVARPDLQDGADPAALADDLYTTLTERLADFDGDTLVAPGHYGLEVQQAGDGTYTARLGSIREVVTAVGEDREAFVGRVTAPGSPEPANADRIVAINRGEERADADEAFELELGPNNCAA